MEGWQVVAIFNQAGELADAIFLVGLYVDDRSEFELVEDVVVLGLAAAYDHEAAGHRFKGVHGRRIGIELVEDDVTTLHELDVLIEGHGLDAHHFGVTGIARANFFEGAQHDVGALVGRAGALDADEETHGRLGVFLQTPEGSARGGGHLLVGHTDGEGYELHLVGPFVGVGGMVFPKARYDAVAVGGNAAIEHTLGTIKPVGYEDVVLLAVAQLLAYLEIAVAIGGAVEAGLDKVMVHAEGTEEDVVIVAAKEGVVGPQPLGAQGQEYGIDDLHHIVAAEAMKLPSHTHPPQQTLPARQGGAGQVNIAGIVLPAIAIGSHHNGVAQLAEAIGKGGVDIAIIA